MGVRGRLTRRTRSCSTASNAGCPARRCTSDRSPGDRAHPRDRDVVRRDRGGRGRRRPASCGRRSCRARPTCTRASAASCPRSRAARTSRSSTTSSRRRCVEAGVELCRHRRGRGGARSRARGRADRRRERGEGASRSRPAGRTSASTTTKRTCTRRCSRTRRSSRRSSRSIVSGGHTLLVAMDDARQVPRARPDGRRRRGRGVRQGRALPRARLSRRSRDRSARAPTAIRPRSRSRARCSTTATTSRSRA